MRIALLSLFALVSFASCTKKTVVNNTVNQAFSAVYSVNPNQWTSSIDGNGNQSFYATLSVPELDDIINKNGGVETYLSFTDPGGSGTLTYETLPEVVDGIAYGSLHTVGNVTVDLRAADGGSLSSAITSTVWVKVVLIDAAPLD